MTLPEINLLAVLLATVSAFVVGFIWFGPKTFFPVWWRAMGRTDEPGSDTSMGLVFGLTVVGALIQAFAVAIVIGWASASGDDMTWFSGAIVGLIIGVGIAAASSLSHRMFSGQGLLVWIIEAGGDITALTVMGAIIGAMA
ncbi:MAG: DUF1761 domain-containing protein [Candidatus Nanopelagicales bacterium]|nr:DUF1761 domain-containing protein [Candidatus Nanopelagicales bacterium]